MHLHIIALHSHKIFKQEVFIHQSELNINKEKAQFSKISYLLNTFYDFSVSLK